MMNNIQPKEHFITKTVVKSSCLDVLGYFSIRELFDVPDSDDMYEIDKNFGLASDNESISIEDVVGVLNSLKDLGATHVQIDYHSDHVEYMFDGIKFEKSDSETIERYKKYHEDLNSLREELDVKRKEVMLLESKIRNL